jgi:hypothetical protein
LLTLLLLGPGSRLANLEPTPATDGLIVGGPGGHGSTLDLLLSASLLLLRRFNHELLALPLVMTHHVGLNEPARRRGAEGAPVVAQDAQDDDGGGYGWW